LAGGDDYVKMTVSYMMRRTPCYVMAQRFKKDYQFGSANPYGLGVAGKQE